jgi:four helix bundle protein
VPKLLRDQSSVELGPASVHNLEIWQQGIKLVKETYDLTRGWPKDEVYGLTAQVRRAAVSVPANLAEGVGRGSSAEIARFSQIAVGSLYELDTLFQVAAELGIHNQQSITALRQRITDLTRRIATFIRYQRTNRL